MAPSEAHRPRLWSPLSYRPTWVVDGAGPIAMLVPFSVRPRGDAHDDIFHAARQWTRLVTKTSNATRSTDTWRVTTNRRSRRARFLARLIEKGLTVLRVRARIRPKLSNQSFLAAKAVVLCQLLDQTHRLHPRERGLIHSFPSNVKGKSACKQAERNTKERIPKRSTSLGNGVVMRLIKPGAKLAVGPYRRGLFPVKPTTRPEPHSGWFVEAAALFCIHLNTVLQLG
jgi:hypothetical protein